MSNKASGHPIDALLRSERMPHIWCPGCGLGTNFTCYLEALKESKIPLDKAVVVSGIGCSGRVAGYTNIDSFHTTHGRAIPFATGLKLANLELNVTVFSGDGDLFAIGGNHFIHAARRNIDITVICVNNFNYGMTGGQLGPTTPVGAKATTAPYGNYEKPFNLPGLAAASGAVYVARWTTYHVRQLIKSMKEAMHKEGFSFIEIISPCPTAFQRRNKLGSGLDEMKFFRDHSLIKNGADPQEVYLGMREKEIKVGKFIDIDKPSFTHTMKEGFARHLLRKK
ncbi:MAG: 2-oxoacid:ferredoxin oxidoreductase subunit beta [Candidatus Altiarchaeota archaeon]